MEYPLIFIIILFTAEIICVIIFLSKYPEIYDTKYRHLTRDIYNAEGKIETPIVKEFESIFGKLCKGKDLSCIDFNFTQILTYLFCIIISIFSGIGAFSYCCAKNNKKGALVVFIISALLNIYNIVIAFEKDEISIDGEIYQYDEELNHRIKKAVDMVHTRSIYLKTTSFLILIIIIAIIPNLFFLKYEANNNQNLNSNNQDNNNMENDFINNNQLNNPLNNQLYS